MLSTGAVMRREGFFRYILLLLALTCACPLPLYAQTPTEIEQVQRALMWLGLYPGPIDGEVGPGTTGGIKQFQGNLDQQQTGVLTPAQTAKLKSAGADVERELKYTKRRDKNGALIGLPLSLLPSQDTWKEGTRYYKSDDSAEILMFTSDADLADLHANMKEGKNTKRKVWYSPLRTDWFALAGTDDEGTPDEQHFYIKARSDGSQTRGYIFFYDPNLHPRIAGLVAVMSADFQAFPDAMPKVAQARTLQREPHDKLEAPRLPSPPSGSSRTDSPALERATTALRAHYDCIRGTIQRGLSAAMPPSDYSRVVQGTCSQTENQLRISLVSFAQVHRLPYAWASVQTDKTVREARTKAISLYTDSWYQGLAKAKQQPERPSSSPEKKSASSGSGVIVSKEGHVLTNAHVVEDCTVFRIRLSDQSSFLTAKLIAQNKQDDLAILKTAPVGVKPASFRIGKPVRAGESVIVYGYPMQMILASSGNITTGIVTALAGLGDNPHQLQISAPVQGGNSGGPLLDENGNVIGIVVAKLGLKAANLLKDIPQNVNFAIKASIAATFMDVHNVPYNVEISDKSLTVPDAGDKAKQFAVNIVCE